MCVGYTNGEIYLKQYLNILSFNKKLNFIKLQ